MRTTSIRIYKLLVDFNSPTESDGSDDRPYVHKGAVGDFVYLVGDYIYVPYESDTDEENLFVVASYTVDFVVMNTAIFSPTTILPFGNTKTPAQ